MQSRRKVCHRASVARSTPNRVEGSSTRRGVGPWRMALIKITTAPSVDFSAEETDRRRRHPLYATVAIAAEAEPAAMLLRLMIRPAPRCTQVVGDLEATTARASSLPSRIGQILFNQQKAGPETPTAMQLMPHHGVLLRLKPVKEDTP